jgi:hypothetical protein
VLALMFSIRVARVSISLSTLASASATICKSMAYFV